MRENGSRPVVIHPCSSLLSLTHPKCTFSPKRILPLLALLSAFRCPADVHEICNKTDSLKGSYRRVVGAKRNINDSSIMQYGKDWRKVEQFVKTRSSSQVRSHAQKFFNKLQKTSNTPQDTHPHETPRRPQDFSQTEFDIQREMNAEQTPSTPMELVSFIRRQSKEDGGKINLTQFRKNLDEIQREEEQHPPENAILPKANSFKSMSNILSVYEEVNSSKETTEQDESFFITITKKYKKLFREVEDFDRLIDLHKGTEQQPEARNRKRSFTLPEGSNLEDEQLEEKIEQIKKKINSEGKEEREVTSKRVKNRKQKGQKERKDSDSSIQYYPPPLNKLSTIQEQPRQEDENLSFRAILSQQKLDEVKP